MKQLTEKPQAVIILALALVVLGALTEGMAWVGIGGVLLYCAGLLQDILELREALAGAKKALDTQMKMNDDFDQRLRTLELAKIRIDNKLYPEGPKLTDLPSDGHEPPVAPPHWSLDT